MPIRLICLDADDTLWQNQTHYNWTLDQFARLLGDFSDRERAIRVLEETGHRNHDLYGYGAKGFILSMFEAALELSNGALRAPVVAAILELGRVLLQHPVELLDGVEEALPLLAVRAPIVLVTKGDLHHQEAKLAASGCGERFTGVEIVAAKTPETYRRIFAKYGVRPEEAVMVGNAIRSDILPALEAGAMAAWIPAHVSWDHEWAEPPTGHPSFRTLEKLHEVVNWLDEVEQVRESVT